MALIHNTFENGVATYGRDGGAGRDIVIGPSRGYIEDREFFGHIRSRQTSVVSVLDPLASRTLPAALKNLMDVWNNIEGGFYTLQKAKTPSELLKNFEVNLLGQSARKDIDLTTIDKKAVDFLKREIHLSLDFGSVVLDAKKPTRLLLMYYPANSEPERLTHRWRTDEKAEGNIVIHHAFNVGGLQVQFKEQTDLDEINGVSFAPGRTMLKVAKDNYHRGWPLSPNEGRLLYAITGTPRPSAFYD